MYHMLCIVVLNQDSFSDHITTSLGTSFATTQPFLTNIYENVENNSNSTSSEGEEIENNISVSPTKRPQHGIQRKQVFPGM